jgi:FdhD protein
VSARDHQDGHAVCDIVVVDDGRTFALPDQVAVEEPLEIRLATPAKTTQLAVTMRTPGHDEELAAGFLFSEGVIRARDEISGIVASVDSRESHKVSYVRVAVAEEPAASIARLERHFFASSACGVCGKTDMEAVVLGKVVEWDRRFRVGAEVLYALPERLSAAQGVFAATGGLHAAALFTAAGECLAVREDVGRHNALDKLIGWALLDGRVPLREAIIMVSGRASFELVQKCSMVEAPVLCAVSAPSSMAVSFARRLGLTLVGFLRDRRFNVYAGSDRIDEFERYAD